MAGNLCLSGRGGSRCLMAKTILNFHFDYWNPSLISANLVFVNLEQLAWACRCLALTPLHLLEVLMDR